MSCFVQCRLSSYNGNFSPLCLVRPFMIVFSMRMFSIVVKGALFCQKVSRYANWARHLLASQHAFAVPSVETALAACGSYFYRLRWHICRLRVDIITLSRMFLSSGFQSLRVKMTGLCKSVCIQHGCYTNVRTSPCRSHPPATMVDAPRHKVSKTGICLPW